MQHGEICSRRMHSHHAVAIGEVGIWPPLTAEQFQITGTEPKTILDLGANCGLSVAYLAARFPQATVAAVEPSIHNYAVAGMNTYK